MSLKRSFDVRMLALVLMLVMPVVVSAQFHDYDRAMNNLELGFGQGNVEALVSGIPEGAQVQLQFQGFADKSGVFDRDQAEYLLDGLFIEVKPVGFEFVTATASRDEGLSHIHARWMIRSDSVELYITLQQKGEAWSLVSVRSE